MERLIVVFSFIGMLFFFFPLFLEANAVVEDKRVMFSFYLFSFIRLFCGYVTFTKVASVLHYSKNKAIYLPYKNMKEEKAIFDAAEGIQLMSLSVISETDLKNEGLMPLCVILTAALRIVFCAASRRKPFLKLSGDLLLSDSGTVFSAGAVVVFNIFTLLRVAVKIIIGRIISAIWKKRQEKVKA